MLQRSAVVELMREQIARDGFPRLQMAFIVGVAGAAAFVVSAGALRLGLEHMGVRYGLASVAGYLAFLASIRLWIGWQRGRWEPDFDVIDGSDLIDAAASSIGDAAPERALPTAFSGGRSGGGGASGFFEPRGAASMPNLQPVATSSSGRDWLSLDFDDAWPIVLAIGFAALGLVAIVYTIWLAPLLLAEVAVDAALVTALYRKLRREDAGTWIGATLRRTWMPAAAVVVLMTMAGAALQVAVPEARSIGGVVRALTGDADSPRVTSDR